MARDVSEKKIFGCKIYARIIAMCLVVVIMLSLSVGLTFSRDDDDEDVKDYSFYKMSSAAATYMQKFLAPKAEKEDADISVTGLPLYVAGGFLGYSDENKSGDGGILGWLLSPLSNSSISYSIDAFGKFRGVADDDGSGDEGNSSGMSGFMQYARYGSLLNQIGFDSTDVHFGTKISRVIYGYGMMGAYWFGTTANSAFELMFKFLDIMNPFRWFVDGVNAVFPNWQYDLGDLTSGTPITSIVNSVSGLYEDVSNLSFTVIVPILFVVLIAMLLMSRTADKKSLIKKFVIRLMFFGLGIPLLGCFYTNMLENAGDGLATSINAYDVVVSTFCDFENWVVKCRLGVPNGAHFEINANGTPSTDTLISLRKSCRSINRGSSGIISDDDGFVGDVIGNVDQNGTHVNNAYLVKSATDILTRYAKGDFYNASDFEAGVKGNLQNAGDAVETWVKNSDSVKDYGGENSPISGSGNNPLFWNGRLSFSGNSGAGEYTGGYGYGTSGLSYGTYGLSTMAMYNYLTTSFSTTNAVVYSNEKAASAATRESHYSVNLIGGGFLGFLYWTSGIVMLLAFGVLGWFYSMSIFINSVKRSWHLVMQVPFAMMGLLPAIARVITYTFMMVIELIGSLFLYVLVGDVLVEADKFIKSFSEVIVSAFGVGTASALSQLITPMTLIFTIIFFIVFLVMALRLRKAFVKALDDMMRGIVDKFIVGHDVPMPGDNKQPGLMQKAANGLATGAGMAAGHSIIRQIEARRSGEDNANENGSSQQDGAAGQAAAAEAGAGGAGFDNDSAVENNDANVDNLDEVSQNVEGSGFNDSDSEDESSDMASIETADGADGDSGDDGDTLGVLPVVPDVGSNLDESLDSDTDNNHINNVSDNDQTVVDEDDDDGYLGEPDDSDSVNGSNGFASDDGRQSGTSGSDTADKQKAANNAKSNLNKAQAEHAKNKDALAKAKASGDPSKIAKAQADLKASGANFSKAQADYNKAQAAANSSKAGDAKSNLNKATAEYEKNKDALAKAKASGDAGRIAKAEADLNSSKQNLAKARSEYDKAQVASARSNAETAKGDLTAAQAEHAKNKEQLAMAKASGDQASIRSAESAVKESGAKVAKAQNAYDEAVNGNFDNSHGSVVRSENLATEDAKARMDKADAAAHRADAVGGSQADQAKAAANSAHADYDKSVARDNLDKANLDTARAKSAVDSAYTPAEKRQAQARLAAAEAKSQAAETEYQRASAKADAAKATANTANARAALNKAMRGDDPVKRAAAQKNLDAAQKAEAQSHAAVSRLEAKQNLNSAKAEQTAAQNAYNNARSFGTAEEKARAGRALQAANQKVASAQTKLGSADANLMGATAQHASVEASREYDKARHAYANAQASGDTKAMESAKREMDSAGARKQHADTLAKVAQTEGRQWQSQAAYDRAQAAMNAATPGSTEHTRAQAEFQKAASQRTEAMANTNYSHAELAEVASRRRMMDAKNQELAATTPGERRAAQQAYREAERDLVSATQEKAFANTVRNHATAERERVQAEYNLRTAAPAQRAAMEQVLRAAQEKSQITGANLYVAAAQKNVDAANNAVLQAQQGVREATGSDRIAARQKLEMAQNAQREAQWKLVDAEEYAGKTMTADEKKNFRSFLKNVVDGTFDNMGHSMVYDIVNGVKQENRPQASSEQNRTADQERALRRQKAQLDKEAEMLRQKTKNLEKNGRK